MNCLDRIVLTAEVMRKNGTSPTAIYLGTYWIQQLSRHVTWGCSAEPNTVFGLKIFLVNNDDRHFRIL